MTHNIQLGTINSLMIKRSTENGFYLVDKEDREVLLPNAYITNDMRLNRVIDVFIYTDSEDRLVATTQKPFCMVNEFAYLEVVDVSNFGAFVSIGLLKDILVPKREQVQPFKIGDKRVVKLIEDDRTGRLVAVEKFERRFWSDTRNLKQGQEVDILVYAKSDLGYKVIINNLYQGLVFKNEVFAKLEMGDRKKAYIKNIRPDGKVDVSLRVIGEAKKDEDETIVLNILKEQKSMPYNYKSDSDAIYSAFGISKKAFKKSLTGLLEKNLITLNDSGITLVV